jgi:hypothetical protein
MYGKGRWRKLLSFLPNKKEESLKKLKTIQAYSF